MMPLGRPRRGVGAQDGSRWRGIDRPAAAGFRAGPNAEVQSRSECCGGPRWLVLFIRPARGYFLVGGTMVRKLLFAIATTLSAIVPLAAGAEARPVVVAEPAAERSSLGGGGALSRSTDPSHAGVLAVLSGLSVLACTLTAILRRRSAERIPQPVSTYSRRARQAFSTEPYLTAAGEGTVRRSTLAPGASSRGERSESVHR